MSGIVESCHSCVIDQAKSASKFANLSTEQTARIVAVAQDGIDRSANESSTVQQVIRTVADAIISELNERSDFDIYKKVKVLSNNLALAYAERLQNQIRSSESPIETAIKISAAGNIIDFGAKSHGNVDIDREIQNINKVHFARYDFKQFRNRLNSARSILFICDNSGEIVFDTLLITELKRQLPHLAITAVVRHKPIINDATLEDAHAVGLQNIVPVISSGSVYPGTILAETTEEFQQLFKTADLIISKGQGNFETLLPVMNERLFFLLRIKCDQIARVSGVEKGNLVLMQGKSNARKILEVPCEYPM